MPNLSTLFGCSVMNLALQHPRRVATFYLPEVCMHVFYMPPAKIDRRGGGFKQIMRAPVLRREQADLVSVPAERWGREGKVTK